MWAQYPNRGTGSVFRPHPQLPTMGWPDLGNSSTVQYRQYCTASRGGNSNRARCSPAESGCLPHLPAICDPELRINLQSLQKNTVDQSLPGTQVCSMRSQPAVTVTKNEGTPFDAQEMSCQLGLPP